MTLGELRAAMPGAGTRLDLYGPALLDAMDAAQINTPLREAHFIAQIGHESGDLQWARELGGPSYFARYDGRADLGNVEAGDGFRFRGRGFIQLTGRANYVAYGHAVGRDLISEPDAVSDEPALCVGVATWFWTIHGLNALADEDNVIAITKRINGGTNGLVDRQARLAIANAAMVGTKEESA